MSLVELAKKQNPRTDKYDLGYINEFYSQMFEPIKEKTEAVLEIGIYHGNSIKLWRDYFTNAVIHGIDVNYCKALENENRIITSYANAYDANFVSTIPDEHFDVVIDDGPHTFDSMVFFLGNYLPKVKRGGLLILEDIIDRSWTPKLLQCVKQGVEKIAVYDMRHKQLTPELENKWKNGLDVIVINK